jgi:hypothetical protein
VQNQRTNLLLSRWWKSLRLKCLKNRSHDDRMTWRTAVHRTWLLSDEMLSLTLEWWDVELDSWVMRCWAWMPSVNLDSFPITSDYILRPRWWLLGTPWWVGLGLAAQRKAILVIDNDMHLLRMTITIKIAFNIP